MSRKSVDILRDTYGDCLDEGLVKIAKYAISKFDWSLDNSVAFFRRSLKLGIEHYGAVDPEHVFLVSDLKSAFYILDENIRKYK